MRTWQCARDGACCTIPVAVVMTKPEWARLDAIAAERGIEVTVDINEDGWVALKARPCPFYDAAGKGCTVYESRPFNCRRFQCGRWDTTKQTFTVDPMPIIKADNDLRWSYGKNQAKHADWARANGWHP